MRVRAVTPLGPLVVSEGGNSRGSGCAPSSSATAMIAVASLVRFVVAVGASAEVVPAISVLEKDSSGAAAMALAVVDDGLASDAIASVVSAAASTGIGEWLVG